MAADDNNDKHSNSGRLPLISVPIHYDLEYTNIDLVKYSFSGTVSILLQPLVLLDENEKVQLKRNEIILHSLDLSILSAKFISRECVENKNENGTGVCYKAYNFCYDEKRETCTIAFSECDNNNNYLFSSSGVLTLDFEGTLNNNMRGFYRSHYLSLDGITLKTMATTQFEPTHARRAFPCFDEPALRATFVLTVTLPHNNSLLHQQLCAVSNTPIESEYTVYNNISNCWKRIVKYNKTPKMSTYLVALVIGEMDYISTFSKSTNVKTSVYTTPGKVNQGKFCLQIATECLDFYSKLFDIPYPLQKCDLLAIPDFAAGAMENWGCMTYREAKILVKEKLTSESMRRRIVRTTCHELAHQWFGNLVTIENWSQLWLKEGIARFLEFVAVDEMFPEWNAWSEFVQEVRGRALALDAMESSHPVEMEIHDLTDINSIFDSISYAKGASIIRMVSSFLGFKTFIKGLQLYLKRHQYGSTTSLMLWEALQEVSKKPVVAIMATWTKQIGFPLVQLQCQPNNVCTISSHRYIANVCNSEDSKRKDNSVLKPWPIPITAQVEGEKNIQGPWIINGPEGDEKYLLEDKVMEWTKAGKWFKLNPSQHGFYRVSYTPEQWKRLSANMVPGGALSLIDRLGLISDSFAAGMAGYASIVDYLKLVENFGSHEVAEYVVWQEVSDNLTGLASLYHSTSFFTKYQTFLKSLYSKQMEIIGWDHRDGEEQRTGTLREIIIDMLTIAGKKSITKEALRRFRLYLDDQIGNSIPADLQRVIFKAALKEDEAYVYHQLILLYEKSIFPEEKRNILIALGNVEDAQLHLQMIEYVLFSGKVRSQDISFPLSRLASSHHKGAKACWIFMKNNFFRVQQRYAEESSTWNACISICCGTLKSLDDYDEISRFFKNPLHSCGDGKTKLVQGLESIKCRAVRLNRDSEIVSHFLNIFESRHKLRA